MWADGFIQVGLLAEHLNFFSQNVYPTCAAFKFKLTVGTGCGQALCIFSDLWPLPTY